MNFDDTGIGAGIGGFIAAILMALGVKSRLDKLEKNVVYKDTFEEFKERFISLDSKVDKIDEKLGTLITRRRDDRK